MIKVGIISSSDKGYVGKREDVSGEFIVDYIKKYGYELSKYVILPDDKERLKEEMIHMADELDVDLILTTGGTGFSKRDVTPEATREVSHRMASGIAEAIRAYSLQITPRAMLSRGESVIRGETLIINMPGSPKAVEEIMDYMMDSVHHGLEIMLGRSVECAREDKK